MSSPAAQPAQTHGSPQSQDSPRSRGSAEAFAALGHDVEIEADDTGDSDSALGDDVESYTTSLRSSITNYTYENGRRYHAFKDGSYYLPNDDTESDRLDLFHHILTLRLGGVLHMAPLPPEPQRILDLGTGTGIWAIEIADEFPTAEVLGNDLSPIQPSMVPPNVRFEVDDMENEWIYSSKFDFIHARYLAGAIKDWPRLVSQAYDFLKPGGWIELQDFTMRLYTINGYFKPGCALDYMCDEIIAGIKAFGCEPEPGPLLEGWVKDAGFVNINHKLLPLPVGTWPKDKQLKEIGAFNQMHFLEGIDGMLMRILTNVRNFKPEEVQVLGAGVRKELSSSKTRAQHNYHVVWAQKPES